MNKYNLCVLLSWSKVDSTQSSNPHDQAGSAIRNTYELLKYTQSLWQNE